MQYRTISIKVADESWTQISNYEDTYTNGMTRAKESFYHCESDM